MSFTGLRFIALLALVLAAGISHADPNCFGQETDSAAKDKLAQISKSGITFLLEKGIAADGSFSKQLSPAVTALCTRAVLDHGVPATHPQVAKSLKYLEAQIQEDGGIYAPGSNVRNYETSVALMCFNKANVDGKYDQTIQKAIAFLKGIQWDESESYSMENTFYGGQGYGKHKRPDLSNTSFFLDALYDVTKGESAEADEAFKKAAVFVSRAQNMPSPQHNTAKWASVVSKDDFGGFIYTPAGEGETKAGNAPQGGLRSYASMTYAGLKSFLYAGLKKDDLRVRAAMDWISRHYSLAENPGVGQQGLFYYYHVFAKALSIYGEDTITDSDGEKHAWKTELIDRLAELQSDDGSWTNAGADRWYEGDPNLVTAYALLALHYCQPEGE
ncbi:MAG: prenyltransferase/squalene oxidase repeat-containing protein [Planctomycetota bacterium]